MRPWYASRPEGGQVTALAGLRARLAAGPPVIASFSIVPRVEVVEIAAAAGFDAVVLDREHGPVDVADLLPLVAAAHGAGIHAIVRVPANDAPMICAALDVGADAVLVPHVSSAEAAAAAIAAARHAPEGHRGVNPIVRAARYGADPAGFLAGANARVAVIAMIEGSEGVAASAEIVRTPGLDAVFVGPYDLSAALGIPGRTGAPEVVARIASIAAEAAAAGIACGTYAPTPDVARRWVDGGLRFVGLGFDTLHLLAGMRAAVDGVGLSGGSPAG
jgi:2-keto-3-deoxy-L-rhamnonate aldolase RhmA